MAQSFYYRTYPQAFKVTTDQEQQDLARKAYAAALQQNLQGKVWLVFDEPAKGLKIVVEWGEHTVHILTAAEARQRNLPPAAP